MVFRIGIRNTVQLADLGVKLITIERLDTVDGYCQFGSIHKD